MFRRLFNKLSLKSAVKNNNLNPPVIAQNAPSITQTSVSIAHIIKSCNAGETVEVNGWVKSVRDQKENVFIDISDGSTCFKLQIFIPQKIKPENLTTGSSITALGPLSVSPKGQIELTADTIKVQGKCALSEGYPFAPRKRYKPEYIRSHLHLRSRTNVFGALLRVRSAATLAIHNYFNGLGFVNVNTPILTSNDCEGAGEIFKVVPENESLIKDMISEGKTADQAYFDTKSFLTVSGQLHLEAVAAGLSKVYTFGPTFRAENSRTRLHLSEFYMLEAEMAFVQDLQQILDFIENLFKDVTRTLLEKNAHDLYTCSSEECKILPDFSFIDKKFPILTYDEAATILQSNRLALANHFDPKEGFNKEHELYLVKHCGGLPTFIINWPKDLKSFYMKECGGGNVAALDLLAPNVGEVVGGSLREDDYEKLKQKIPHNNPSLDWYLDLRKFGGVSTGGFGLGFERYLIMISGIANIKDVIPFPRWPHYCKM